MADAGDKTLRLMMMIFAVNLVLIAPGQVLFGLGLKGRLYRTNPNMTAFFDWLYFFAIAVNPIVYAVYSKDLRGAYKRVLHIA